MIALAPFILAALMAFLVSAGIAQEASLAENLYKGTEQSIRADYAKSSDLIEIERKRKISAGEPPVPASHAPIADRGIKQLLYSKAVTAAVCGEQSFQQSKDADAASRFLKTCMDEKSNDMLKALKMGDYATIIDRRKSARCEMKARDYANEIRLPPFDFLRTADGPPLFDYKALTDCLLSDRD
jgi:hypothetical protein